MGPATALPVREPVLVAAKRTLDMIADGTCLPEILEHLCLAIDAQNPAMMSTVLLADEDGHQLKPAAGPRVPRAWVGNRSGDDRAGRGLVRGCGVLQAAGRRCGHRIRPPLVRGAAAAFRQARDRARDPGLLVQPLLSSTGAVLGTFCMYYGQPSTPTEDELRPIEDAGRLAVIAIEGERARAALERAMTKLRQDERELRQITDAIAQTISVLGPDGTFLYWNRSMREYTGLTMDDARAADYSRRVNHPDDAERFVVELRDGLEAGAAFEIEKRTRVYDGVYRWNLVRLTPLRDERGEVVRWYATGTDIHDRKIAEERMRNENVVLREDIDDSAMFEEIVGSSPLRRVLALVAKVARDRRRPC